MKKAEISDKHDDDDAAESDMDDDDMDDDALIREVRYKLEILDNNETCEIDSRELILKSWT